MLWFDRACIDQQHISEQLACLPVWLSGCRTLLVLAGSTYTKRLWCVLEVFTFLRMGGEPERISLVPLKGIELSEVRERFTSFDVHDAQCSSEDTTQLLLGVIESGFGDLQTFNSLVRAIFSDKLVEDDERDIEGGRGHYPASSEEPLVGKSRRASRGKAAERSQSAKLGRQVV